MQITKDINKDGATIATLESTLADVRALNDKDLGKLVWQAISNAAFRTVKEKGKIAEWVKASDEPVPMSVWLAECGDPEARALRGGASAKDKAWCAEKLAAWNLEARAKFPSVKDGTPEQAIAVQAKRTEFVDAALFVLLGDRAEKMSVEAPEWDADSRDDVFEKATREYRVWREKAIKADVYA